MKNLISVVVCHIVGDYLFQTDYMAREKGKDWYVLFVHCVCYCIPFAYTFGLDARIVGLFATHIMIDALKARYEACGIFVDQLMHYFAGIIIFVI